MAKVDKKTEFPSFEEVLGTLELAVSRKEDFRIPGEASEPDVGPASHRAMPGTRGVADLHDPGAQVGSKRTRRPVAQQAGSDLPRTGNFSFISFNYDLLIDNAIGNQGLRLDYGTTFANPFPRAESRLGLYKLHGSLNWLRCPICGGLTQTGDEKGGAYPLDQRPKCATAICGPTPPIS